MVVSERWSAELNAESVAQPHQQAVGGHINKSLGELALAVSSQQSATNALGDFVTESDKELIRALRRADEALKAARWAFNAAWSEHDTRIRNLAAKEGVEHV